MAQPVVVSLVCSTLVFIHFGATWRLSAFYVKQIKKYYEVSTIFEYVKKLSMIIGCNI